MLHTLVHREGGMRENNIVRLRPARSLSFSVLCLYSIIVVRSVYDLSIIISCFIFSFHPFFPQIYTHTSYFRPSPPRERAQTNGVGSPLPRLQPPLSFPIQTSSMSISPSSSFPSAIHFLLIDRFL